MECDLPKDPVILLSYVNTQLRDNYESFEELCASKLYSMEIIEQVLGALDYRYDVKVNQFI